MREYNDPTTEANRHPALLTSAELVELLATRHDLVTVIDCLTAIVDWYFRGTMPATYAAHQEIVDLIGDLTLRRAHLQHYASDTEQLASQQ